MMRLSALALALAAQFACRPAAAEMRHFDSGSARSQLEAVIYSATARLDLRLPRFDDEGLKRSVAEALSRGVKVRLLVGKDAEAALNQSVDLIRMGLKARVFKSGDSRYAIADRTRALLGQLDGTAEQLELSRQSVLYLDQAETCKALQAAFHSEWGRSAAAEPEAVTLKKELDALPDPRDNEPRLQMKRRNN